MVRVDMHEGGLCTRFLHVDAADAAAWGVCGVQTRRGVLLLSFTFCHSLSVRAAPDQQASAGPSARLLPLPPATAAVGGAGGEGAAGTARQVSHATSTSASASIPMWPNPHPWA